MDRWSHQKGLMCVLLWQQAFYLHVWLQQFLPTCAPALRIWGASASAPELLRTGRSSRG